LFNPSTTGLRRLTSDFVIYIKHAVQAHAPLHSGEGHASSNHNSKTKNVTINRLKSQRLISFPIVTSPALILFAEAFQLDVLSSMPAAAALFPCWGCRSSGRAWGRHCSTIVDPLEPFEARL